MEMSLAIPSRTEELVALLILGVAWIGPVGLFVLRRHWTGANGAWRAARAGLYGLTAITAPVAAATLMVLLFGAVDAFGTLWTLLEASW